MVRAKKSEHIPDFLARQNLLIELDGLDLSNLVLSGKETIFWDKNLDNILLSNDQVNLNKTY